MLSFNMKTTPPATSVTDASLIFGARDGQTDPAPEPFSVAVLWAHLATKVATLVAGGVSTANTYTDTAIQTAAAGTVPVRYDATQPTVDCLWIAPSGQVVLITGSA